MKLLSKLVLLSFLTLGSINAAGVSIQTHENAQLQPPQINAISWFQNESHYTIKGFILKITQPGVISEIQKIWKYDPIPPKEHPSDQKDLEPGERIGLGIFRLEGVPGVDLLVEVDLSIRISDVDAKMIHKSVILPSDTSGIAIIYTGDDFTIKTGWDFVK